MAAFKFHWKFAQRAIGGDHKFFHTSFADAPRRADFSALTSRDLQFFQSVLGSNGVRTEELDDFNVDFMRWYKGNAACVLFPSNAEQVSTLLAYCHSRKLAVVPQAGNTGLVGGSVPVYDEIVLSTRRIAKKFAFDASSGIVQCDSGFVLEEVDNRLAADGYMVPVDLGAKGSCLMGGIVATNAGGIRLIRYGSMHANVTGLEVVLADKEGSRLRLGSNLRKDNTELHLHKLFIGSEGQLGIITGVSMQVVPRPVSILSAFLGVNSFEKCRQLLHLGKQMLNEILSSFELIDTDTMELVEKKTALASPLGSKSNFYLLVETSGSDAESDAVKMDRFLSHALDSGLAENGVLANSRAEADHLWKIRENCPLASRDDGYCFKHDMSLPLEHFYELTEVVKERLNGKAKNIVTFGHMGDGNTHLNVTTPEFDQEVYDLLYPFIYEWVASKDGSISAEHGIGRLKRLYHHKLVDPKRQQISRELKKLFDPNGILSPYKMID